MTDKPVDLFLLPLEHAGPQCAPITPKPMSAHAARAAQRKAASDERWNQIYKEKFEDPDYYKRRPYVAQRSSALADF